MLQKSSIYRLLEVFFIHPTKEQYLMDISRNIKLAHTSVKKNLEKLESLGLIVKLVEKRGKRKFPVYKSNMDNRSFKKYKQINNLVSILESNLVEYIEEKLTPKSIVLFGSYLRGEDTEQSDIDIFVECREEKLELWKFERKLSRKIELHCNENFTSYSKELKNSIINGIVLSGFLEGYK